MSDTAPQKTPFPEKELWHETRGRIKEEAVVPANRRWTMRNIWRELAYFVGVTDFFTNIPRQRVSYAWPREALAVGLGLTVSTSVFTAIIGKFTSMIGVAVALLGAAIVWSLCCIAWNTWLAVREEVGVNQPTPPPRGGYSPSPPTTLPSGPPPLPIGGTTPVTATELEIARLRDENTAFRAEIDRLRRILAALREPSEGVLRTVFIATFGDNPIHKEACLVATQNAIRAAVTAAEQEVGYE